MSLVRRSPVVRVRGFGVTTTGGGGAFTPLTYDTAGVVGTLLSGSSGTITIPSGATQIVVEVWGGGGGGGGGQYDLQDYGGGGGGSGGYAKVTRALSGDVGKSISWAKSTTYGLAGTNDVAPAAATPGNNGGICSATGATLTNTFNISCGGGGGGGVDTTVPFTSGGSAGTSTGGDSGSTIGNVGVTGSVDTAGTPGAPRVGIGGRTAGGGGGGGLYLGAVSPVAGDLGRVIIYLT